jgi:hypothetical protein
MNANHLTPDKADALLLALWLACCVGVGEAEHLGPRLRALLAQMGEEQVGALDLPARRNAPVLPVLNDLNAVLVNLKLASELRRAAKLPNQGPIRVLFSFHSHMVHVRCSKSTVC